MIKNTPDKEDRALLKGKSPSYIAGWNKVKHRAKEQATAGSARASRPGARGRKPRETLE